MGGGLPAAAFGGRAEIMARLAPGGPVYQAGTLSGNPLAIAAGLATLRACTPEVYARVDGAAALVARLATEALTAAGVPHRLQTAGNLFSVFLGARPGAGLRRRAGPGGPAYAAFFHAMLDGGVYLPPSAVRGVVPVRVTRRRRDRAHRRRPPRRRPRRRRRPRLRFPLARPPRAQDRIRAP